MAFCLAYTEKGKIRKKQFKSYYECVVKKQELRKQGIDFEYNETGADVSKYCPSVRLTFRDKQKISKFVNRCDKIEIDKKKGEKMDELVERVIEWGRKHQIDNLQSQACKIVEEFGETLEEMNHERFGEEFEDGVGDTLVSLIIFADIAGKDVKECLKKALTVIENRTGKTKNGNFIKSN